MSVYNYSTFSVKNVLKEAISDKFSEKCSKDLSALTTLIHISRNVASYPILKKIVAGFAARNPEIQMVVLSTFPSLKTMSMTAKGLEVIALGASTLYLYNKYMNFKKENIALSQKFTATQQKVTDVLLKSVSDVFLQNTRNLLGIRTPASTTNSQRKAKTTLSTTAPKKQKDNTKLAFGLIFATLAICIFDPSEWGMLSMINENKNPLIILGLYQLAVGVFTEVPSIASKVLSSAESGITDGVQKAKTAVEQTVDKRLSKVRQALGENNRR